MLLKEELSRVLSTRLLPYAPSLESVKEICLEGAGDAELFASAVVWGRGSNGPTALLLTSDLLVEVYSTQISLHKVRDVDRVDIETFSHHARPGLSVSLNKHKAAGHLPMFQWTCEEPESVAELSRFTKELVKALQS